ncbi:hypothetical protein [Methylobacterium longum]|uniref:Uncharacterized protein n=1 Tax=Methylobacterium longum TaxID=767694 RepID=A0ABT8AQC4_9HYPH|nr:hypothetical protein [Methylobacterium longum]MDN3571795.1 hypothetical protein [Methylobacterium longum]GJE13996.1 hypothetical protein FOHLNKBM_5065 [Methylobacterium longum]
MKWLLAVLLILGAGLIAWGLVITSGRGSADERVGGAIPIMAGVGFIVLALIITGVWTFVRA